MKLKTYRTGLLASYGEREQPAPPYNGAGWQAALSLPRIIQSAKVAKSLSMPLPGHRRNAHSI